MTFIKPVISGLSTALNWAGGEGRWKWLLACAGAVLMAALIYQVRSTREENASLETALAASQGEVELLRDAREISDKIVASTDAAKTIIIREEAIEAERIEAALEAEPDWANQPLPDGIVGVLREQAD